jgi:hypothetical protein
MSSILVRSDERRTHEHSNDDVYPKSHRIWRNQKYHYAKAFCEIQVIILNRIISRNLRDCLSCFAEGPDLKLNRIWIFRDAWARMAAVSPLFSQMEGHLKPECLASYDEDSTFSSQAAKGNSIPGPGSSRHETTHRIVNLGPLSRGGDRFSGQSSLHPMTHHRQRIRND